MDSALEVGQLVLKRTHNLSSAANAFTDKNIADTNNKSDLNSLNRLKLKTIKI